MKKSYPEESIPFTFKTRDDLLNRLEGMRPLVAKLDASAIRAHKAEEVAWLKKARAAAKVWASKIQKLSYEEAKELHSRRYGFKVNVVDNDGEDVDPPNCPNEELDRLERAIEVVGRLQPDAVRIRVAPQGQYAFIHEILMIGVRSGHKAVC